MYIVLLFALLLSILVFISRPPRNRHIPTINAYSWDILNRRAIRDYNAHAKNLIAAGRAKYGGPFQIITPNGRRIILPSSTTEWVKNCKDLDHQELVREIYFADYSGFDGNHVLADQSRYLHKIIQDNLSHNSEAILLIKGQVEQVLRESWPDRKEWCVINWQQDSITLISRMSARIFVGPELAVNSQWQDLTISHTLNMFSTVEALRQWPSFMRPIAHLFLPQSRRLREQVRLARVILGRVLETRILREELNQVSKSFDDDHNNAITWLEKASAERHIDHVSAQLALAIAALHTTSEGFRMTLIDICQHSNLVQPLREEIEAAVAEHGWTPAGLFNMYLLDSVMKESQRMKGAAAGIERLAMRDVITPSGTRISRGSKVAVDSGDMWDSERHKNPEAFDGYRFLRIRQSGGMGSNTASFVSTNKEHNVFGGGRSVCAGRFFASHQIKIALAHVLLAYDVRLKDARKPRELRVGFFGLTDPNVVIEVRKRDLPKKLQSDNGFT